MPCTCGHSKAYPICDGTHKIVKKVKEDIKNKIDMIDLSSKENEALNAVGLKILISDILK